MTPLDVLIEMRDYVYESMAIKLLKGEPISQNKYTQEQLEKFYQQM